jgi:hypothetical protein
LLDTPENNKKRVNIHTWDSNDKRCLIMVKGDSFKAKVLKKKEVEFKIALFKAKNPGISREEIELLIAGLQDGIDYSEARQPLPLYAMDLDSQIERAQSYTSCTQIDDDKDPQKVFKKMVKEHFKEEGCIPTDVLEKAAGMRTKRYNAKLDRFNATLYNGNFLVKKLPK